MSLVVKVAARHAGAMKVVVYLASDKHLHHDQRLITGSVYYPGPLDRQLVAQVAADLNAYQQMTGTETKKGHIYHVALSASPENGPLSDQTWADISNDFMTGMGFEDQNKSPIRWTAVNHGANAAGADHIHIVMSTVRQNGTQVSLHNDMKRASKLATELERKYGLGVLQTRLAVNGAGSVPFTGREVQEAREQGKPEPDRVTLERRVRLAAAASATESEFVERLRKAGIQARPFPQGDGEVTGYSVRTKPGAQAFGGGKLAKDLTLPQLRRRWPEQDATQAWRGQTQGATSGANALKLEPGPLSVQQVLDGLTELGEQIQAATAEEFADLSHELSAALAAVSEGIEDVPGELAGASREVGAWAQPERLPRARLRGKTALMLFAGAVGEMDAVRRTILVVEVVQAVRALHRLHRASRLVTGPERGMAMASAEQAVVAGSTAISRLTQEWHRERRAMLSGADARVQARRDKQMSAAENGPWDRQFITASRRAKDLADAQQRARERAEAMGPRATQVQREEVAELAAKVGIDINPDHLNALSVADVEKMRESFAAVPGVVADKALPDPSIKVPTGLGDVHTAEDADAFLRHLERKHGAKLDAKGVGEIANVTNLPPAPATVETTEMTGAKDPRNWGSAADAVTKRQAFTLKAAGLTPDQVATLNKGEASFVIGSQDTRAAFEENRRTSPFKQSEAPVATAPVLPTTKPEAIATVTPTPAVAPTAPTAFPVAPGAEKFNAAVRPKPGLTQ